MSNPVSNPQFFTFQDSWVSIFKRKKIPWQVQFQTEFGPTNIHSTKLNDLLYQLHTCLMPPPTPIQPSNVLFEKMYT
jgi:fructosamine-3-kinase